mgnify:CR=1 FL=1
MALSSGKRAFSLLELTLSCALLSLFFLAIFVLFERGIYGYSTASKRMDSAAEMRAIVTRLESDAELATLAGSQVVDSRTVNVVLDSGAAIYPRHIVSLPGLGDWSDPLRFDEQSGLPLWDRYFLYHAELAQDSAALVRVELRPPQFSGFGWTNLPQYVAAYPNQAPARGAVIGNGQVGARRALTTNLLAFEAIKTTADLGFIIRLRSRTKGATGLARDEVLEARVRVVPKNKGY